jgi:hypothetical protein
MANCPGPLVWFGVGEPEDAAILECGAQGCDYLIVTGNFNDPVHSRTDLIRSHA